MAKFNSCAVVRDNRFKNHITGYGHPECPDRLTAIEETLNSEELKSRLVFIQPRPATMEELCLIHTERYVTSVAETEGRDSVYLDPDTQTSALSYETAVLAAGGLLSLIDRVWRGEHSTGFAFVRPPGHHAESDRAMGFCLFNNVAVGARYLIEKLGAKRVLIVDWDLHHGNGTEHSFWRSPDILYFSIHQFPHYPGTGRDTDVGAGSGKGYTVNVPLGSRNGDISYLQAFSRLLKPIALQFKPDIILVSAGFDAHFSDPLGGIQVTDTGYRLMTRILIDIAHECCGGKLVFVLEGGYNFDALKSSVRDVMIELLKPHNDDPDMGDLQKEVSGPLRQEVSNAIFIQKKILESYLDVGPPRVS